MKKLIIISTFLLLLMPTSAFCGNLGRALGQALPQAIDNISKIKQMEMQEREMERMEQEERMRYESRTDFKCMRDCLDAEYSFFYCKKVCSY